MSDDVTYAEEIGDVEWDEITCAEYEEIVKRIGYREEFGRDAPDEEQQKLSVHIGYTDPEGHRRSKTVWGNGTYGLILWWSGYLGRYDEDGKRTPECKHWLARHARSFAMPEATRAGYPQ